MEAGAFKKQKWCIMLLFFKIKTIGANQRIRWMGMIDSFTLNDCIYPMLYHTHHMLIIISMLRCPMLRMAWCFIGNDCPVYDVLTNNFKIHIPIPKYVLVVSIWNKEYFTAWLDKVAAAVSHACVHATLGQHIELHQAFLDCFQSSTDLFVHFTMINSWSKKWKSVLICWTIYENTIQ